MGDGEVCRECAAHLYHIGRRSKNKNVHISPVLHLDQPYMALGRDPKNELVLPDNGTSTISRVHAIIKHLPSGDFILQDNNSVNGVFVNDVKLGTNAVTLRHNDTITLGGGPDHRAGEHHSQPQSDYQFFFCITKQKADGPPSYLIGVRGPFKREASLSEGSSHTDGSTGGIKRIKREVKEEGGDETAKLRKQVERLRGDLEEAQNSNRRLGQMVDRLEGELAAARGQALGAESLAKDCTCSMCRDMMVIPVVAQCAQ